MNGTIPNQQQYPTSPQPLQPQAPTTPENGKQNKWGAEILIIVFLLIFATFTLNYFNILPLSSLFPNYLGFLPQREVPIGVVQAPSQLTKPATESQQTSTQASSNTIIGPTISLKNEPLKAASINYFLWGKLREIRTLPEGIELVTDITGDGIPSFVVTNNTIIVFNTDGQQTPATTSDFAPNQEVGLAMNYNLNKKTWTTFKVHIFTKK